MVPGKKSNAPLKDNRLFLSGPSHTNHRSFAETRPTIERIDGRGLSVAPCWSPLYDTALTFERGPEYDPTAPLCSPALADSHARGRFAAARGGQGARKTAREGPT